MEKYQRIDALSRTQLLFGESKMKRINNVKVIIFGIGEWDLGVQKVS